MNITFACRTCHRAARVEVPGSQAEFACPHCQHGYAGPAASGGDDDLSHCLVCGCQELFVRSNFPQRLGVAIVALGFVASTVAWYYHMRYTTLGILFATALIDVLLYVTVGTMLQCYRCQAEYRGLERHDAHAPFSLETHERYRQTAARLAEQERA